MNFPSSVNHAHMLHDSYHYPPQKYHYNPKMLNPPPNRFIYVKNSFFQPPPVPSPILPLTPKPKVLVNPHFKKKVYVNPQFQPPKPKIHVNPNILKKLTADVPKLLNSKLPVESKSVTVISTKNKLVRIPASSPYKLVRKRRNSLHSQYKIVRSSALKSSPLCKNQFKLDKRKLISRPVKKKYVYINRFLNMNVVAKNVLLKKNPSLSKPGFVNINGILYKKSPNSLRKAQDLTHIAKKSSKPLPRNNVVKRFKVIRVKKPPVKSLRKCNIPCPIYRKYGKCPRKDSNTCFKVHNPDQIVLCTRFLQGACHNKSCLLSHKVSHEKMPTCKYYLDGLCSKDDCPYLHVKISPKADICKDFLEGFCRKGAKCDKRHQFLCPDFEKNKTCPKRRCPYPHGNMVRKVLNMNAKKCSSKKEKVRRNLKLTVVKKKEIMAEKNRYYQDFKLDGEEGQSSVAKVMRDRPKLGELPVFIPFFDGT